MSFRLNSTLLVKTSPIQGNWKACSGAIPTAPFLLFCAAVSSGDSSLCPRHLHGWPGRADFSARLWRMDSLGITSM